MLFFKSFEWDATEFLIITFQSFIWNFTFLFIDLLFWTLTINWNWWWGIIRNLPDVFPPFITWEWACTRYRGLVGIPSWNGVRNIAPLSCTSSNTTQQLHKNGKNGGCLVSTSQLTSELSTASNSFINTLDRFGLCLLVSVWNSKHSHIADKKRPV